MNKAMDFDQGLVNSVRINRSDVEKRVKDFGVRRTFKVEAQAAAYVRAVQCLDLTTLQGDDTSGKVERLCAKALNPVNREILRKLGLEELNLTTGAICVYYKLISAAQKILQGKIPIAAVSTGFPAGQTPLYLKNTETEILVSAGANEIDVVISRDKVLTGQWKGLYEEIKTFREICGDKAKLKTILGVGNLGTLENIAKASAVAIMAGSDFIKTSTGFEPINATLENSLVMVREIRRFHNLSDSQRRKVGFKPAGGIKTAKDAANWLMLMLEELGEAWTRPELFRIGASSLLNDLERQLSHLATGCYSAGYRHPMA
ncbi:MAG: deoxyribose-phosphate aldolase [Patescibacteria group bacterium]